MQFIIKNRVVDSVIRTLRNAFENDNQFMANNKQMQKVVEDYNNTPHELLARALNQKGMLRIYFTPS